VEPVTLLVLGGAALLWWNSRSATPASTSVPSQPSATPEVTPEAIQPVGRQLVVQLRQDPQLAKIVTQVMLERIHGANYNTATASIAQRLGVGVSYIRQRFPVSAWQIMGLTGNVWKPLVPCALVLQAAQAVQQGYVPVPPSNYVKFPQDFYVYVGAAATVAGKVSGGPWFVVPVTSATSQPPRTERYTIWRDWVKKCLLESGVPWSDLP